MDKLPYGCRFAPKKHELVDYLRNKVDRPESNQFHPRLYPILDVDVYSDHPYNLLNSTRKARAIKDYMEDTEAYFYSTQKRTTMHGSRISRCVGNWGTWKEQNSKEVQGYCKSDHSFKTVGIYRYFKFLPASGSKLAANSGIEWQMHEYSLLNNKDTVLCHIVRKIDKTKKRKCAMVNPTDYGGGQSKRRCVEDSSAGSPASSSTSVTQVQEHHNQSQERICYDTVCFGSCSSYPVEDDIQKQEDSS